MHRSKLRKKKTDAILKLCAPLPLPGNLSHSVTVDMHPGLALLKLRQQQEPHTRTHWEKQKRGGTWDGHLYQLWRLSIGPAATLRGGTLPTGLTQGSQNY